MPDFRKKVSLIVGDLETEGLGLSENDKKTLIRKVNNSDYSYHSLAITFQRVKMYYTHTHTDTHTHD